MKEKAYIKQALTLLIIALITLGFAVSTVSAWDWDLPDSDDLEDWWDDTTDQAKDWWDDTTDQAKDTRNEISGLVNEFQEAIEQDLDKAIDIATQLADSSYAAEAWNEISVEKERLFCEEYSDPEKVGALEKRRGIVTEGAIIGMKLIPIYDPKQKQVRTFSVFARDMVGSNPALEGSDLAEDPVRCATLMLLDGDYLEHAKIIQTTDGKWVSMNEALVIGYKTGKVQGAMSEYKQAKTAYNSNDPRLVESQMEILCSKIQEINSNQKLGFDPLWLLPVGLVIGVAGVLMYGRKKSKEELE